MESLTLTDVDHKLLFFLKIFYTHQPDYKNRAILAGGKLLQIKELPGESLEGIYSLVQEMFEKFNADYPSKRKKNSTKVLLLAELKDLLASVGIALPSYKITTKL